MLNRYMVGKVRVQVFIVSGPGDAEMDIIDELWIQHQVVKGLGFLRGLARANNPPINVSFVMSVRRVGITTPANALPLLAPDLSQADVREQYWRNEAQVQLGHPPGLAGVRSLVAAGGLDHSLLLFVTRYPLATQAYADPDEPFVMLDWGWIQDTSRGGKGFGHLGHVVAHEVCHTFDAPDEYAGCTLLNENGGGYGFLDYPNFNCVDVDPDHSVTCLMKRGKDAQFACSATRVHLGWVDSDQDGVLDVFM